MLTTLEYPTVILAEVMIVGIWMLKTYGDVEYRKKGEVS